MEEQFKVDDPSNFHAILVVSTSIQIKKAIVELSADLNVDVQAISLNGQTLDPSQNGSTASARQLSPSRLSTGIRNQGADISNDANAGGRSADVSAADLDEFEELDRWFGLADEKSQAELRSYLLLIERSE